MVRGLLARLGLLLASILIALALAEGALRLFGYAGDVERTETVAHPRYGHVRADSWIFDLPAELSGRAKITIGGRLVPLEKGRGERRVLFLGDSGTEGTYVPVGSSYPYQLEELLDQANPQNRTVVINAGVWGMTTSDELHFLEDKLLPLAPDVVVIGFFLANDINFNLAQGADASDSRLGRAALALRRHSALAHFLELQALVLSSRVRRLGALGRIVAPGATGFVDERGLHMLSYPEGELAIYHREPSALVERSYDVLEELLARFRDLGREHGFSPRVFLIPTPSSVVGRLAILHHPDIIAELAARGVVISEGDLDFAEPSRRVRRICRGLGIVCIDPTASLRELGLRAYLPGDEHPSELGHRRLAEVLFANRGLLLGSSGPTVN
jgi:lysophospholipase L1-like esterase